MRSFNALRAKNAYETFFMFQKVTSNHDDEAVTELRA
jgi:hypothetical protein